MEITAANQNFRIKVRYSSWSAASAGSSRSASIFELRLGHVIAGLLDRLTDSVEIDRLRMVFDVDGIRSQDLPMQTTPGVICSASSMRMTARAAMHVLDWNAERSRAWHVADGPDRLHDIGEFRARRLVSDPGRVRSQIDMSGRNPWHGRKRLLDCGRAMGTCHASDTQLNLFGLACRRMFPRRSRQVGWYRSSHNYVVISGSALLPPLGPRVARSGRILAGAHREHC